MNGWWQVMTRLVDPRSVLSPSRLDTLPLGILTSGDRPVFISPLATMLTFPGTQMLQELLQHHTLLQIYHHTKLLLSFRKFIQFRFWENPQGRIPPRKMLKTNYFHPSATEVLWNSDPKINFLDFCPEKHFEGALQRRKNLKKSEFTMKLGGWVQVSFRILFLGKSSKNCSKPVLILSIPCVFCLYRPIHY